jgi:hypothetical protein
VQPLVPYITKARPYIPPVILALIAAASIPIFFTVLVVAFFTAPVCVVSCSASHNDAADGFRISQIWLTIGFFTEFIWIQVAIFAVRNDIDRVFIASSHIFSTVSVQHFHWFHRRRSLFVSSSWTGLLAKVVGRDVLHSFRP